MYQVFKQEMEGLKHLFKFNINHKVKSTGFQPVSFSSENEGAGGVNCSKNFRI